MDLTKDFYVNLKNGRFDSTTATEMDGIFAKWNTDPTRPLIVHFHCGLVNEKSGMKTAQRLLQFYWDSGGYPVFFVWEAGTVEVLTHNLSEIFDERLFKRLLQLVSKFVIGKLNDGGARGALIDLPPDEHILRELRLGVPREVPFEDRSAAELPEDAELTPAQEQQFRRIIETDSALATEVQAIANSRRADRMVVDHCRSLLRCPTTRLVARLSVRIVRLLTCTRLAAHVYNHVWRIRCAHSPL